MKPVPSCAAGSDAVAGQTRQALTEVNRSKARTSAAVLGLAISMGASHLLVPQPGEAAVSKNLPATDQGNWMPASPKADSLVDLEPVDPSLLNGSDISQSETPSSSVNQLSQKIGSVSETDDPNSLDLKVRTIGAIADTNVPQPPIEDLSSDLSSIEPTANTEAEIGKPEPSFLVTPVLSKQPEFLFSAKPINAGSLDVSLPSVEDELPAQGVVMSSMTGTLTTPTEALHKTITPGSGIYSAVQSDSLERQEMLMNSENPLAMTQHNPETIPAGMNPELDVPQINIEYSHPIPVPEISSAAEVSEPVEAVRETVEAKAELNQSGWSEEAVARDMNSDTETERPIPIKPVEYQFSATPLPLESNLTSEVVVSPDLTNAVVIESAESADTVASASRIYQVGVGETLDAIAQKNNVSVSDLITANKITDPHFIKADQKIKIPLIDPETSANLNDSETQYLPSNQMRSESSLNQSVDPLVLGTDAIYPLAPTRRTKVNAESRSSRGLASDAQTKTPYVNSLKADLEKLREKYPVAQPEDQYQSQPELPIESAWQPSNQVVVAVPDLPVATGQPTRAAIQIAQASQDFASENSGEIPETPANGYVQELISDIERLRQNREDQEAAKFQWQANENSDSSEFSPIAPAQSSEQSNPVLQAAIGNKPEKRQRPFTESPENAKDPREEVTSDDLLATGSSGTAAYQPLLQPTTGQMVTPQLPPLNGPDTYLPNSPAIFNGYIWPAQGVFTSGYGWRWGRMHNGIDIAGPVGTPIFAAAPGVVTYAGWNDGGYGNLVEIEHPDGSFTIYAHNNRILVREGQEVDQGEQVAEMGSTGFSTGPHLHFEIHPSGQGAVNPMAFLPAE